VFPGAKAGCGFAAIGFAAIGVAVTCVVAEVTPYMAQDPAMGRARPWDTEAGTRLFDRTARSTFDVYVVLMSISFSHLLPVRALALAAQPTFQGRDSP
jgi:hypothetical protein